MKQLQGKVAVVTGGASGIGLAMAARFARDGMKVVLADIEEPALEAARAELAGAGADVLAVRTDVADAASVTALAEATFARFGTAHVVCNNAGVGAGGFSWQGTLADWKWTIDVNLWGVVHGIRAFVPRLVEQREGHVINTASMAGLLSVPGLAPYCVTKHAVVTLTECLHHELALFSGGTVHASVLCPGFVKTRIMHSERNRPAELTAPAHAQAPHEVMMQERMKAAVEAGIPAEQVADAVVRAILEERFYILTHPEAKPAIERRAREILDEKSPTFDPRGI
ncbi:MAG: SDR family NAD(P)-dependent oxidoreductase [Deltaproteobacteria bacterium]|nr:SDR family NAD(P)-dependent oxidoreductase [Deltaproteobacteria bacterium]MCW5808709.1 SDR family NAD(P)-dependent oxidoreductase [Deltaproteobacteria bacterium]